MELYLYKSVRSIVKLKKQKIHTDENSKKYVFSDGGNKKRVKRFLDEAMIYEKPISEALSAGFNTWFQRNYPRIQIVTIQEIIAEGKRIDLPLNPLVLKTAPIDGLDTQADLLE